MSKDNIQTLRAIRGDIIDALSVELSADEIVRIETVFPAELLQGVGMRNFTFRDGRMEM